MLESSGSDQMSLFCLVPDGHVGDLKEVQNCPIQCAYTCIELREKLSTLTLNQGES